VRFGVPDMHFHAWFLGMRAAMEMMVTGDSISGTEAVRLGWANGPSPKPRSTTPCSRWRSASP
jgi:enoyl-CoA hydratase